MKLSAYLAAPLACATVDGEPQALASTLRAAGYAVTSRWHDMVVANEVDPTDDEKRKQILAMNLEDLDRADVVVALVDNPAREPKATYGEITYALAKGKPVAWLHGPNGEGRNIFDAHALVRRCRSFQDVLGALREWSVGLSATLPSARVPLCPECLGAQTIAEDGLERRCERCDGAGVRA